MLERKDIDAKYKWDLSAIYPDEKAFYEDFSKAEKLIKDFKKHEKTMCRSAKDLYAALNDMAQMDSVIVKLWQYANLNFSLDTSNNNFQALSSKVRNLAVAEGAASWFVSPYMIKLDSETLESWFSELPELETYRRMIEKNMQYKPHTLSDESEQLISKMQDCLGTHDEIRNIFANSDLRFGKIRNADGKLVEITDTNFVTFLMSPDRRIRRAAFRTVYKTYDQFKNTFATIYEGRVKEACTMAKIHNFKDSLTASTFGDEVTPEIYNNLISTVSSNLQPIYDYYELKREVLGIDKFHLYDVYTPLIGEFSKKYPYDEAVEEVLKTVKIYGEEYESALREGLTEKRWVDVYPTRGKRSGAFSSGAPNSVPYILLNYNDTFNDISILAHESGHSMHTYFASKYNEPHNALYTIFVAEVASTVNELLLCHRKLRESRSDDEKLFILNELMETYKGTLYRQTMFAEFEKDIHTLCEKGHPLTSDVISKRYYKLVKKYFGKDVACDKQIAYEWMRIPHLYTCFYVYKYATCISAASAIVKRIETEGEAYVSKYIDFLKCGDSRSPLDSLLVAEIDMTKPEVITSAIDDFASAIAQFREIYNKRK